MAFTLKMGGSGATASQAGQASLVGDSGQSVASGSLMAMLALQKVTASINDAASKLKRRRDRWKEMKEVFGDWIDVSDARQNGWQALTCTTEPKPLSSTGVSLDEASVPKEMASVAYQFQRAGKVLLEDSEDELESATAEINAWQSFLSKETLSSLGIQVDPMFYVLMAQSTGGLFGGEQIPVELDMTDPN